MDISEIKSKNMLPILLEIIKKNLEDNTTELSRIPSPSANSSQLYYSFNEIKEETKDTYILVKTSWPLINKEITIVTYCIFMVKYNNKYYIVPYQENNYYFIEEYEDDEKSI